MNNTNDKKLSQEAMDLQAQVNHATVIGAQTYWENRSGVTRQELRDAAAEQKLDIVVPDPKPEGTFKGVIKGVAQWDKDLVARETRNDDVLTYAIARVDASEASQVGDQAGEIVNRVLWRKVEMDGQPRFAFMVEDMVAQSLTARYEQLMSYMTADEIREAVGQTVKGIGGIRLLGRLWFVGLPGYDKLLKVKATLTAVGMVCHIIPTLDLGDSRESMAHNAKRQVWQDIQELRREVDRWKAGTRNPRKATLEDRLSLYKSLRDGVENMADVLQMKADDLRAELEAMQTAALAMLDPDAAPPPAATTEAPAQPSQGADSAPEAGVAPQGPSPDASADSGADSATQNTTEAATAPAPPSRPAAPGNGQSLDTLTMKELRRRAKDQGLRPGKLNKAALIAALQEMQ